MVLKTINFTDLILNWPYSFNMQAPLFIQSEWELKAQSVLTAEKLAGGTTRLTSTQGPYTVTPSTPAAVEVAGVTSWTHHTWVKTVDTADDRATWTVSGLWTH